MTCPHVYYASYGSNLLTARFLAYLLGGHVAGNSAGHAGARDPTPPPHSIALRVRPPLRFARASARWNGGGVCFLDVSPAAAPLETVGPEGRAGTWVRGWLVSKEQFVDVVHQENGVLPTEEIIRVTHIDDLIAGGPGRGLDLDLGWYGHLFYLGDAPDGVPVLTFTCPPEVLASSEGLHNPPSLEYARVIYQGLLECGLPASVAHEYLTGRGGCALPLADLHAPVTATYAASDFSVTGGGESAVSSATAVGGGRPCYGCDGHAVAAASSTLTEKGGGPGASEGAHVPRGHRLRVPVTLFEEWVDSTSCARQEAVTVCGAGAASVTASTARRGCSACQASGSAAALGQ
jgi:hypothetical protein